MVHNKNRNPPPPPTTAADHGRAPPPDNNPNQEQTKTGEQLSSIKSECQLAIAAFRRNPAKAHKLIEAACLKYENCALVHAARSNLHALEACRIGSSDVVLKQKYLIGAAQSARRAVSLSPNSIEFGVFYAEAMYELSRDVQGLVEVVRECERGLSIENPIDPAEESFRTAWLLEKSTAEERILECRKRLELILQKSRSASLSLKNLAKGNPLDCVMVGVGSVVTGRKNANRKEIKIGVLEERSEKLELDNYRMSERKRQAVSNEIVRASVKKGKSQTYWNAMSDERKMGLLELRVGDLREYYSSLCKDGLAVRVFSEGIAYAEKNKSWKFWGCYYCDEKFEDMELRMKHIERKHEGEIGRKLKVKPFVFPEIDAEWADLLVNGTWKPVDTPRAIKMIGKQLKSQLANLFDEDCSVENCAVDQLSDQEPNESQHCRGRERRSHDETLFGLGKSVGHFLPEAFRNDQKWPLSDDIDRANILQEIHRQFQVLVRDKFLSVRNLNKVITYTIAELQNFIPASQLQIQGLGKSPLCICFLEVSQLEKILEFLQSVYELSGSDSGKSNDRRRYLITERIVFTGDSSRLMDDRLLRVEFMPHRHHDGVEDYEDGSATTCSICNDEVAVPPDINAFTQWLFDGPSISAAQQLAAWTSLQDEMKHEGMKASKEFEEAFNLFQSLYCWQHKLSVQWRSFQVIETVCAKELKKREQGGKHVPQSCKSILTKMLEPFVNAEEDSMSPTRRSELDAILEILTEADGSNEDAFIMMAIQKKIEQLSLELCRIAEPITRNAGVMWRILAIYKQASLDYRGIMLALVQIFIHAKLEALVNEEEKQKSDAVTEALLSELALDTKKNTSKGNNDPKLSKKTSKAKKKIKDHIKVKDPKATCVDELTEAQEEKTQEEKTEQGHFAVVGVSADELKLQEEELRRNILLEDRKLKEMLEYQRQVEDEAKRMALTKETTNEATPIKVEELDKPVVVCSQRTKRRRKKDSSKARKNLPLKTIPESEEDLGVSSTFGTFGSISGADIFNPGLRNDAGEYNCFLNVIVQTLWHLRRFREVFMSRSSSEHVHIGDPCIVCALKEIFIALSVASANKQREAISPTSLRNAVIKLDPDRNLFQEPHMYDTTEVLAIILDSLHESSMGSNSAACSWDCVSDACIAHNLFGMAIHEKIICSNCGIESREEQYTSCMNGICASFLRTMKNIQPESHFDELFKLAESNYVKCEPQFACDTEKGGCGKPKSLLSYLRTPPHVFSIALLWPTDSGSREDILATLTALTTEIDLAVFHDGVVLGNKHSLFSMVCYFGQHHICFAYSHELEKWIMCDDETVEEVGCWDDVISTCERRCLQPQFLFFEAVK